MSELREKIADIVNERVYSHDTFKYSDDAADAILLLFDSSPVEGLEVVKECPAYCRNGTDCTVIPTRECPSCHGAGEIVRPMTRAEMEEWALSLIQAIVQVGAFKGLLEFHDGRVRVKP